MQDVEDDTGDIQVPNKLPPHTRSAEDNKNLYQTANEVKTPINVLGLVNGMVSSTILVLPYLGIVSGYASSILLCILFGFVCYYTAFLLVTHIGR
jgi:hypothetical protein